MHREAGNAVGQRGFLEDHELEIANQAILNDMKEKAKDVGALLKEAASSHQPASKIKPQVSTSRRSAAWSNPKNKKKGKLSRSRKRPTKGPSKNGQPVRKRRLDGELGPAEAPANLNRAIVKIEHDKESSVDDAEDVATQLASIKREKKEELAIVKARPSKAQPVFADLFPFRVFQGGPQWEPADVKIQHRNRPQRRAHQWPHWWQRQLEVRVPSSAKRKAAKKILKSALKTAVEKMKKTRKTESEILKARPQQRPPPAIADLQPFSVAEDAPYWPGDAKTQTRNRPHRHRLWRPMALWSGHGH